MEAFRDRIHTQQSKSDRNYPVLYTLYILPWDMSFHLLLTMKFTGKREASVALFLLLLFTSLPLGELKEKQYSTLTTSDHR